MGTELLIGLALAFIVLGPERMHSMLGHLGRAKAQFDNASKEIRDQLAAQQVDGGISPGSLTALTLQPMHPAKTRTPT